MPVFSVGPGSKGEIAGVETNRTGKMVGWGTITPAGVRVKSIGSLVTFSNALTVGESSTRKRIKKNSIS
jgi:hypothetical protein